MDYSPTESRDGPHPAGPSVYAFEMNAGGGDEIIVMVPRQQLSFSENTTGCRSTYRSSRNAFQSAKRASARAVRADARCKAAPANKNATFAGQTSVGGSSIAENAFFVNGLNITNFDNYLGASLVPFEFYARLRL